MRKPNWKDALARGRQQLPRKGDWRKAISTRSFRVGGYSMAAAAIVVVIAVVANLLVNALPASATQFDTSQGAMYTLSLETTDLLAGLEEDVTVYWIVQSGQEDETLSTLLDRYTGRSDHLILEKKDPDVDPGFLSEYVTGTVYNNSLIVTSDTRDTYVSYEDIYTYEYSDDYTSYNVSFNGESALTSAIDYVLRDTLPKVYTLTGHGEGSLSSDFQSAAEQDNVEFEELSLLSAETVPEDADCVLILAPQSDIADVELTALQAYLDGGGYKEACHAVVNALSIVAGMVCDGAKPSCAGKIAFAVNAGILGYVMYRDGQQFYGGDGIVKKGVENTIDSVAQLGREGMRATNEEIIKIMLGS